VILVYFGRFGCNSHFVTAPLLEVSQNHLEEIEATKCCRWPPTSSPKTRCRRRKMPFPVTIIADFTTNFGRFLWLYSAFISGINADTVPKSGLGCQITYFYPSMKFQIFSNGRRLGIRPVTGPFLKKKQDPRRHIVRSVPEGILGASRSTAPELS